MQLYNYLFGAELSIFLDVSDIIFLDVSIVADFFTVSMASILFDLVAVVSVVEVLSVFDLQAPKEITADTAKIVKSFFMSV